MNTNEIFENLVKIEPKVVSIETLFNNEDTLRNTNYSPDYQRNYVWDEEKASYFIESILLGTEIPPIIYFRNGEKIEIIDGRQRYETILRFIKNQFKLKKSGLHKLDEIGIGSKFFKEIGELRDVFWDTKLRIIEFSFHTKSSSTPELEEIVKKEIFKRYNSGITPLKPTEIDKAVYFDNDLNSYIQEKLKTDKVLLGDVIDLFPLGKGGTPLLLKKIRQLLVQHKIPIKYYAAKKDIIISDYFELLCDQITDDQIETIFSSFNDKINILKRIKNEFTKNHFFFNRLVSECIFWGFSIIEQEGFNLKELSSEFIINIAIYINDNKSFFEIDRSSFYPQILVRYNATGKYFSQQFNISFENYVQTSQEFKTSNRLLHKKSSGKKGVTSFDDLRINKPEPSSITIVDICRQMEKSRFLVRPAYQRTEVINKNKSSAIIESILLGIKLPPIFVYKREDGISEVLDGQQRLLSIIGFLKKEYLDENNKKVKSAKDGYSLSLKNGILKDLDGRNFKNLEPELIKKINNFDLWIIEINHRYNKDFEPIDLFLRLNSKPYPIKENTFEMWNSYINRDILDKIKATLKENEDWFYFRKNNKRMESEFIYTALAYLQYELTTPSSKNSDLLEYYKVADKMNFRIRSKTEITKVLESPSSKEKILQACDSLKSEFISKVRSIVEDKQNDSWENLNKNLEFVFNRKRSQQSFYALWHFLRNIPLSSIEINKQSIRKDLGKLFASMTMIESKDAFEKSITNFWRKYNPSL